MTDNKQLEQQLWNIANALRGKMGADDFRDYILGFIFYKYLSEKMHTYPDKILKPDGLLYKDIDEGSKKGKQYLTAIREEALDTLGYFLKPSELFSEMASRGNGSGKHKFILDDLTKVLNNIAQSTMGTDSEEDFDHLFEDLDLTSSKLGKTESAKNELIVKVLVHTYDDIIGSVEITDKELEKNQVTYGDILFQRSSETREEVGQANVYLDKERSAVFGGFVIRGKKNVDYEPIFLNYLLKTWLVRKEITTRTGDPV